VGRGWHPTLVLAGVAAISLLLHLRCGHRAQTCPPVRRPSAETAPPFDADTLRAVKAAGFRYERCEGRPRYRLLRPGTRDLTDGEMQELERNLLPATPGPSAARIGTCECATSAAATGTPQTLCISIALRAGDLDPPALANLLSGRIEALSLRDVRVRVRVDVHAKPGPRCLPSDRGCGPIPIAQKCPADVGYVPGGPRHAVFERLDGGPCSHDGECDSGTCDSCFSTRESDRHISGDCFSIAGMKPNALCGCVAGSCTFFTQSP
jgi:hypothetical protein